MLADIQRGSKLKKVPPRSKPHALVLVAPPHTLVLVAHSRRRRARYSVVRSEQSKLSSPSPRHISRISPAYLPHICRQVAERVIKEVRKTKPKQGAEPVDLITALKERMSLRRKGISGSRKGVEEEEARGAASAVSRTGLDLLRDRVRVRVRARFRVR